jgi:hypothetical protein
MCSLVVGDILVCKKECYISFDDYISIKRGEVCYISKVKLFEMELRGEPVEFGWVVLYNKSRNFEVPAMTIEFLRKYFYSMSEYRLLKLKNLG